MICYSILNILFTMKLLKKFLENELNLPYEKFSEKFENYSRHLLEWNQKINLISRKLSSIEPNILTSIYFLKKFPLKGNEKIFDIGTGGGFPGIPLKILYSYIEITLNDSIGKKILVVDDIISKLNFRGAKAVTGRAEELAKDDKHKKKYDIVISKAVADIDKLWQWGSGLLKRDGKMLFLKGGDLNEELTTFKNKFPKLKYSVEEFSFPEEYKIEDKKIILI